MRKITEEHIKERLKTAGAITIHRSSFDKKQLKRLAGSFSITKEPFGYLRFEKKISIEEKK